MSYLSEFRLLTTSDAKARFLHLWEEYCLSDTVDGKELLEVLTLIKNSPVASLFGEYAETALPLWQQVKEERVSSEILRVLVDLQTTNSTLFADLAVDYLQKKYGGHKHYNDFLRISGLRFRQNFQGAISRFELLHHMEKGNFVFHFGGWGVGEIIEVSLLREHTLIEFERAAAPKDLSFDNAFKTLVPLSRDHFLARRFGDPDALEKQGKEDPLSLIHLLLDHLGPKSAAEIKEELCDLVIPESDWAKWWGLARTKLKKDTKIKSPESAKERFELRKEELGHDDQLLASLSTIKSTEAVLETIYSCWRDFSSVFKNPKLKAEIKVHLLPILEKKETTSLDLAQKLQASLLLEEIFPEEFKGKTASLLFSFEQIGEVLDNVSILAFRKEALTLIREKKEDWIKLFLQFFFLLGPNHIRDYILRELLSDKTAKPLIAEKVHDLLHRVTVYPEAFFWYFQKMMNGDTLPLSDKEHQKLFLEAFFILLHYVESQDNYHDLAKKMHHFLTDKNYLIFRTIIEKSAVEYLKEVLLLATKCQTFSKQDHRIFQSLAEVVQPEMSGKKEVVKDEIIWTTADSYRRIQERIKTIGTVEMIENAKEIEAARALGDLRENAEYKAAQERRARLQSELKNLSRQLNMARIITKDDVVTAEVSVGTIVDITDSKGKKATYTLLGPWDADPDKHILSLQSKLASAMLGKKKGEKFEFMEESYTIHAIKSLI